MPEAYDRLIVPYVNANPWVFENYLMYTLHSSQFPRAVSNYADGYVGFLGEFIAMLVFTAGVFHKSERLTDEKMAASIYLFHRKVSHNINFRKEIAKCFSTSDFSFILGICGAIE